MSDNRPVTPMLKLYILKFAFRLSVFFTISVLYIRSKIEATEFLKTPIFTVPLGGYSFGIAPLHLLWCMFMIMMFRHIFPAAGSHVSMALRKSRKDTYIEVPGYSESELLRYVKSKNTLAWWVLLAWIALNAVVAALFFTHVIGEAELMMITLFYFIGDYVCILLFCPFQTFMIKSKCCVNCRIFVWGHFMMFTPMLFIRSFYSWSLFFTSLVVLIRWEIIYAKHPEWFWEGSNKALQCANCNDRTCRIKKQIRKHLFF